MRRFFQPGGDKSANRMPGPAAGVRSNPLIPVETNQGLEINLPKTLIPPVVEGGEKSVIQVPQVEEYLGEVISDVASIPGGRYLDFLSLQPPIPESFKEHFAVFQSSDNSKAILLTAKQAFSSHSYFEINRRLKNMGLDVGRSLQATSEIIKTIHAQHTQVQSQYGAETQMETLVWRLIDDAVRKGASDIHIETRLCTYANVSFRIHGERAVQPDWSFETALNAGNILYTVHADANTKDQKWSPDLIQDGAIERTLADGTHIQLRFSSGPIHPAGNFHIVLRILRLDGGSIRPIEEVGYTKEQCTAIEKMLNGSSGLVLLVGPTNSGKSTSLQAFIRRIYDFRGSTIKVITVEDPVEYLIPNACQMGVPKQRAGLTDKDGKTFNSFLKGTLRQDPDVVMIGEIRNDETASAGKDLVLAGRKILSTLHVYEAFAVFPRLRELGVPESLLTMQGFISGIIYQRLVPIQCPHCSVPLESAYENGLVREDLYHRVLRNSDSSEHNVRVRSKCGCEQCGFMGIIGRTPCAEIVLPDNQMLSLIRSGNELAAKAYWQQNSSHAIEGLGVTALAHALYKMHLGMVDPHDIETQIGIISSSNLTINLPIGG